MTTDTIDNAALDDLAILTDIIATLKKLQPEERDRILQTVERFFGAGLRPGSASSERHTYRGTSNTKEGFSEDRSIPPKVFMVQKQPRTDVERVACLAYYLTHYRDMPHFKTIDLSKLNTEAAQPKFSNPAVAADNATKMGYLVSATDGNKQLSAVGEYIVQAMPDRNAVKALMIARKPRRRSRKSAHKKSEER